MRKPRAPRSYTLTLISSLMFSMLWAGALTAQVAKQGNDSLSNLQMRSERLAPSDAAGEPLEANRSLVAGRVQDAWAAFRLATPVDWRAAVDKRTGKIGFAEGGDIAWIPGRGNALARRDIAKYLGNGGKV